MEKYLVPIKRPLQSLGPSASGPNKRPITQISDKNPANTTHDGVRPTSFTLQNWLTTNKSLQQEASSEEQENSDTQHTAKNPTVTEHSQANVSTPSLIVVDDDDETEDGTQEYVEAISRITSHPPADICSDNPWSPPLPPLPPNAKTASYGSLKLWATKRDQVKIIKLVEPKVRTIVKSTQSYRKFKAKHVPSTFENSTATSTTAVKKVPDLGPQLLFNMAKVENINGIQRNFQLVIVVKERLELIPTQTCFKAKIRDVAVQNSPFFELFGSWTHIRDNAHSLRREFFLTTEKAHEWINDAAFVCCRIMDRWQATDDILYNAKYWKNVARSYVEKIALVEGASDAFALQELPDRNPNFSHYRLPGQSFVWSNSRNNGLTFKMSRQWVAKDADGAILEFQCNGSILINIHFDDVNPEVVEKKRNAVNPIFKPLLPKDMQDCEVAEKANIVVGYICTSLFGMIGTTKDISKLADSLKKECVEPSPNSTKLVPAVLRPSANLPQAHRTGIYGGSRAFKYRATTEKHMAAGDVRPCAAFYDSLSVDYLNDIRVNAQTEPMARILATCVGSLALQEFQNGGNALTAWQTAVLAGWDLYHKRLNLQDLLITYCQCEAKGHSNTHHPCMGCHSELPCHELAPVLPPEDVGGFTTNDMIRLCRTCRHDNTVHADLEGQFMRHVWYLLTSCRLKSVKKEGIEFRPNQLYMFRSLLNQGLLDFKNLVWRGGYDHVDAGRTMLPALHERTYTYSGRERAYLFQKSIDAVRTVYLDEHNQVHVHHPDNITIVPLVDNLFKGWYAPPIMVLGKAMAMLQLGRPPYDFDNITSRKQLERQIVTAADHQFLIRFDHPLKRRERVQSKISRYNWDNVFEPAQRTGIWNPEYRQPQTITLSYGIAWGSKATIAEEESLKAVLKDLVREYPEIQIPIGTIDEAPFPFFAHHFRDDFNMADLHVIGAYHLHTMETSCNKNHPTNETWVTIIGQLLVEYFETGGCTDRFLCSKVSPFCRHPFALSIGRGLHVEPGSPMRTGFTRLLPRGLQDYDRNLTTVQCQTRVGNMAMFYWPPAEREQILPHFADDIGWQSQWHDNTFETEGLLRIKFPASKWEQDNFVLDKSILIYDEDNMVAS